MVLSPSQSFVQVLTVVVHHQVQRQYCFLRRIRWASMARSLDSRTKIIFYDDILFWFRNERSAAGMPVKQ